MATVTMPGQRPWAQVQIAALAFVLTLALCALTVGASIWYLQTCSAAQARAQQLRAHAFDRLSNVEHEKRDMAVYTPPFVQLRERGLIGEENRLAWMDAIGQIGARRKLGPISYEFEARQPLQPDPKLPLGDYQLRTSRMHLHMELLHEMDLLHFLDDLKAHAFFAVQDCALRRGAARQGAAALLTADCTLNWFTLGLPQRERQ